MTAARRQAPQTCGGCKTVTTEPVLIRVHMEGSGPGGSTYGCPSCIEVGRLTIAPELADLAAERRADQ